MSVFNSKTHCLLHYFHNQPFTLYPLSIPPTFPSSPPHLPREAPPSRWPSRAGPAPAGVWAGAGRRVERVQPAAWRRAGPASAGPGHSRGTHRRSIGEGGSAELAPLLQWGCCGWAGVFPDRPSTPRGSRDWRKRKREGVVMCYRGNKYVFFIVSL